jgi:hypothetical protein
VLGRHKSSAWYVSADMDTYRSRLRILCRIVCVSYCRFTSDGNPNDTFTRVRASPVSSKLGMRCRGATEEESQVSLQPKAASSANPNWASKSLCRTFLETEQIFPVDSLFRDDLFEETCEMVAPNGVSGGGPA